MACRSRGDEHLCVEADDVLLDATNSMAVPASTSGKIWKWIPYDPVISRYQTMAKWGELPWEEFTSSRFREKMHGNKSRVYSGCEIFTDGRVLLLFEVVIEMDTSIYFMELASMGPNQPILLIK